MAEGDTIAEKVTEQLSDLVNETFGAVNGSTRDPGTPLGQGMAYTSLVLMAVIPIYMGAWRSAKKNKDSEVITQQDAMTFPLIASCTLFGIFIFYKMLPEQYINMFIALYFFVLGSVAMIQVFGDTIVSLFPFGNRMETKDYKLSLTEKDQKDKLTVWFDIGFDTKMIFAAVVCVAVAAWYSLTKHWIANNLIALAFAINAIEILKLNSFKTGSILLTGLFFYDIFWVFGTNVMVTVARKFDAPIKVVFPQDLMEKGIFADKMAMLGLGDIVIPGIFIALLLRFDLSLNRERTTYFKSGMVAYLLGLLITLVVMVVFKHAQPALLYLVPAGILLPSLVALFMNDFNLLLNYEAEQTENEVKQTTTTIKEEIKTD